MHSGSIEALIHDFYIGQDAAENEKKLDDLFFETEPYRKLVNDEVDLILGHKGTGKSAIYRMLDGSRLSPDTLIVRAVNPQGQPLFKRLFNEVATEERLRDTWAAYIVSLVANRVIQEFTGIPGVINYVEELSKTMQALGLREIESKKTLLDKIRKAKTVTANINGTAAGLISLGLSFDLSDIPGESRRIAVESVDFYGVAADCAAILRTMKTRLWVTFDRLDECFTQDSDLEKKALRTLLRTQIDLASFLDGDPSIRLKIFLRTDLLTRVSIDYSFPAATHFRKIELRWSKRNIEDFIYKRIMLNENFAQNSDVINKISPNADGQRTETRIWSILVPPLSKSRDVAHTICEYTCDAHRAFNPRNVVTLLRLTAENANNRILGDSSTLGVQRSFPPLFTRSEVDTSLATLSTVRLNDTVNAEYPNLRSVLLDLEGGPASFQNLHELMSSIDKLRWDRSRQQGLADQMRLAGILQERGRGYVIPKLYRSALKVR